MGGIAAIAREAGHTVTGCDANVYPPMSTQLRALDIELTEGYDASQLATVARDADVFVVGNAISRGNPLLEAILDAGRAYTSGPQWLAETVLPGKWVLAVAGTHGKTTTTSMLAWILEHAELSPGFLIGGVAMDFEVSARLTDSPFFVIEADEYDTAFLRQALQVRPLSAAHRDAQQPRIRPRRHLSGPGGDRDTIPPSGAHGAAPRPVDRQWRRAEPAARARARLLERGRALRAVAERGRARRHRCRVDHRRRRHDQARGRATGRTGASAQSPAGAPQPAQRARRARRRASRRRARRERARLRCRRSAASSDGWRRAASSTASLSTTTSRTIPPRSRSRSRRCAAASAARAFSRCSSRARTR